MDGRFSNQFTCKQEEPGITSEYGGDSHFSGSIPDGKMNSISSPKRSRRAVQKRVVSIPIGDVHGSRLKGGDGAPPSDSWAWRKYGQKPIKGSPYPRGYYRCSSSKGCPARKQVERSRVDPTMLVITYACEHNHPGPASRNPNSTTNPANKTKTSTTTITTTPKEEEEPATTTTAFTTDSSEDKFGADLTDESLITTDDFNWFSDVGSTSPLLLESSICAGNSGETDADVAAAMIFPMGEEDESLFADLGELPECSVVFRRGCMEQQEERRRCSLRAG